jgi:hypothetical protein
MLDAANSENVSGYDFLRVLVRRMMTDSEEESSSVRRPLTAAFRGVERDKAYGSYLVTVTILTFIEKKA